MVTIGTGLDAGGACLEKGQPDGWRGSARRVRILRQRINVREDYRQDI